MAYFNHAFHKVFLGTKGTQAGVPATSVGLDEGFIMEGGINSVNLSDTAAPYALGPGTFGFFDKDTYESVEEGDLNPGECCPLVLAAASLKLNDKQGPFHGGYQESNKSKYINPKLIREFYRVDQCTPQQHIVHIGNTNYTAGGAALTISINAAGTGYSDATDVPVTGGTGSGLTVDITQNAGAVTSVTINNPGSGYTAGDTVTIAAGNTDATVDIDTVDAADADCCKEFFCDETYYLRIDIKGSPALRFANHNIYQTLDAKGGCCTGPTPTAIDSTIIFQQWALQIINDPYLKDFIKPVVFSEAGDPYFATAEDALAAGWSDTQLIENYVEVAHTPGACAGMRLMGAYVDTVFGNCAFQLTDHYEREPIRILSSLVDYNGNPCEFEGLCYVEECPPLQGMGFGEQVVRDVIKHESYLQNFFSTDIRIREITQGDQLLGSVNRANLYTRYFILHSVPRFNNPTGVFDNDQYLLDIVTNAPSAGFESFMETWLTNCGDECASLEVKGCTPCTPIDLPTP